MEAGPVKPNGIPEINWKHRLRRIGYVLVGHRRGFYVDLVNFRFDEAATGSTAAAGYDAVGQGFNFIAALANRRPGQCARPGVDCLFPAPAAFRNSVTTAETTLFGLNDVSGNNPWNFFVNLTTTNTVGIAYGNAGSPFTFTTLNNTFYVAVGSATGATAQSCGSTA